MGAGNICAFFHLFPLTACPERLSVRRPGRTHRLDGLKERVEVREARASAGRQGRSQPRGRHEPTSEWPTTRSESGRSPACQAVKVLCLIGHEAEIGYVNGFPAVTGGYDRNRPVWCSGSACFSSKASAYLSGEQSGHPSRRTSFGLAVAIGLTLERRSGSHETVA